MNTLPTNEEADCLPAAIKEAAKAGVDAFIVADLGVLDAKRPLPRMMTCIFPPRPASPTGAACAAYKWAQSGWCWPGR